jgi:L-asparaginase
VTSNRKVEKIVVLATGGTIAGRASSRSDNIGYLAAQVGVAELLECIPSLTALMEGCTLVTEQIAQIDSKDMSFQVWQQLALRVNFYLTQADVKGIVITHGTDTLEETAYFLHAVLPADALALKPVVLTCAMRPATSVAPDGPQNMLDAFALVLTPGANGVVVVCAGTIHGPVEVQKVHPYRLDAFSSGDVGPLGFIEEGRVRSVRHWPLGLTDHLPNTINQLAHIAALPRVEIVMNYADASGFLVDALIRQNSTLNGDEPPLRGLVVAATGNGSMHQDLEAALIRAQQSGVTVVVATRCSTGIVLPKPGSTFSDSKGLSPVKARVALMLALLG